MRVSSCTIRWVPLFLVLPAGYALPYDPEQLAFNLNQNQTAIDPLEYWGQWENHSYHPSPKKWRMPFYTIFLDRFVNGDPSNDDANGTQWEHDLTSNQFRHGGDVLGLMDSFDYLQGMGIKAIYFAGMPHINEPWGADGYSPLDLTLLDHHFGSIEDWRTMIADAHRRGMYIILENTMATLGDLIGFRGFLNTSAPLNPYEYDFLWKTTRRYHDFQPGNDWLDSCEYPRFWDDLGAGPTKTSLVTGCRDSEFDQYGEVASFGNYTEWERQITKFAFVQDRLREWRPDVRRKIEHFSCLTISMLDVDGFRIDKALQVTLDAQGEWSDTIRQCARRFGKENFYIPGEIVSGNSFGALYIGRGRQTNQTIPNMTEAVSMTNASFPGQFLRSSEKVALDGAAFHYTVYRALTRFLGMDGTFEAEGDPPVNFVELWAGLVATNDMVNVNTGKFDPRHLYGTSNQDVFRWPSIRNGTEKQVLALYIVSFLFPGIPILTWGEEQAFYILENSNANYVFGRSPMSSAQAWQLHGCYKVGSVKYQNFPIDSAAWGCEDDNVSLDHRDPTHPIRGFIRTMFETRQHYPVLNDGYYLQQLSNKTYDIYLPGSNGTATETGLWSVLRARFENVQDFTDVGQGNQSVWMVYQNDNHTINYPFNCSDLHQALISPFDEGTTVKNLLPPFDEYTLEPSVAKLGLEGSSKWNGCLSNLTLQAWGFKAFVPKEAFVPPSPFITRFSPGHDWRILSTITTGESVRIAFQFSDQMNCDSITKSLSVRSSTSSNETAVFDNSTVSCYFISSEQSSTWQGSLPSVYNYSIELTNVYHGVHEITVTNVTNEAGNAFTNSVDHFFLRIGSMDNPIVWPRQANYSTVLLHRNESGNGNLYVMHKASGADLWRYTLDFGSTYSDWMPYTGANSTLAPKNWTGTKLQAWTGEHVMVQYFSKIAGSSDHYQHGDLSFNQLPRRRFPHIWVEGEFNHFGYDAGYRNQMELVNQTGLWQYDFLTEWPAQVQFNVWGMNPDGLPDQTQVFGDIDGDQILDRIPPISLLQNFFNITEEPPWPYLAWRLAINDGSLQVFITPVASQRDQIMLFLLLALIPVITACSAVWIYLRAFYQVKFNKTGITKQDIFSDYLTTKISPLFPTANAIFAKKIGSVVRRFISQKPEFESRIEALNADVGDKRRTVLIATIEYQIEDWDITIKIGGLGVMAQLMGKSLGHQELVWVVPCVGGVNYPVDQRADPISVTILGQTFQIEVQYHKLRNITFVLLDAPVFRGQSKTDPYPSRMDDLDSAIYYSAWNACIAESIRRFPVDLYHINDYHGAAAPLYLLPRTIPCCLSLHNAEFQGLWPMRTSKERQEVCEVFNLDPSIVKRYIQFGDVFNLLHAGVSYLHIHQNGFGAVGVSKKYGKRSWARYPIFWGLKDVGSLPNPDPSDTAEWRREEEEQEVQIDAEFERARADLKQQAQEWAGLDVNATAELFVFVGRWSMQKGVDLIADVFPSILENHKEVQLICVGPVIDLYGKFASIKLQRLMALYPGRVYSKPEFTSLPPFIFSGAEFALIPSRDEPFGLVAVEFGRKGALGVGSRVGGLGQMPGWWYTIESMTTKHLLHQFKGAIHDALSSKPTTRALMRARSGKQRFPVAQWVEGLEQLQCTAIEKHKKHAHNDEMYFGCLPRACLRLRIFSQSEAKKRRKQGNKELVSPLPDGLQEACSGQSSDHNESTVQPSLLNERVSSHNFGVSGFGLTEVSSDDESSSPRESVQASHYRDSCTELPVFKVSPDSHDDASLESLDLPPAIRDANLYSRPRPLFLPPSGSGSSLSSCLPSGVTTPSTYSADNTLINGSFLTHPNRSSNLSLLSVGSIIKEKQVLNLQKVDPFFTDSTREYGKQFESSLAHLNGKTSEDQLCIEDFLSRSEKDWFNRYRWVKMGRSPSSTPASSIYKVKLHTESTSISPQRTESESRRDLIPEFPLPNDYVPPSGLKLFLLYRIGDWPLYSIILAFGQIIAANSYQITLLSGEVGETAQKLYVVATIYLVSSIIWWMVFRTLRSIFVLSTPFLFYGSAFLFIGFSPLVTGSLGRSWMQNIATGLYAFASSSGSIFFALNFGDEGSAAITSWVYRACIIQGTQQIYVTFLWYWGASMAASTQESLVDTSLASTHPRVLIGIGLAIAMVMYILAAMTFLGLPDYYRQSPGKVPAFYRTLNRRKIIVWFFYAVFIQNYWLSAPYGRNWLYLWSSKYAKPWEIIVLVVFFFILIWTLVLWIFGILSKRHAWFLPIFAIGLGAPRWCQMLWSTSNIGSYVPWTGSHLASALIGRGLWLWLGVLDALQGVGFGMILLNTLTRFHIAFTLLAAQVIGSIGTILARATAPDKVGPGDVFPDFSGGIVSALNKADFWVCLLFMLSINGICFMFFRKEQLQKP